MVVFSLVLLLCSLATHNLVESAGVLDNSSDPWKNWLLNEDSSPLSKRITAKSVFIAPIFDKCPQGQRLNHMGKCVKVVHLDEASNQALHLSILETKLKLLFPASSSRLREDTDSQTRITTFRSDTSSNCTTSSSSGNSTTATSESIITTITTITTITEPLPLSNVTVVSSGKSGQADNTSVPADVSSGPFQLSIPFHSKNSSKNMDDEGPILGVPFTTTTMGYGFGEMTTDAYTSAQTTLPPAVATYNTNHPDGYADDGTENVETMTTTTTTNRYQQLAGEDTKQIGIRFPESNRQQNESTVNWFATRYLGQENTLPSNGRTRPKCDLDTRYECGSGGATKPNTVSTAAFDKLSYMTQYGNRGRASHPPHMFIRFPSSLTQEGSSVVRFPPGQKQPPVKEDTSNVESVMFPLEDVTSSRYSESSRHSMPTYWGQSLTVPSKAQFVRIWPSSAAVASNYNAVGINYSFLSQRISRTPNLLFGGVREGEKSIDSLLDKRL